MKQFFRLFILLTMLMFGYSAVAQITIDEVETPKESVAFKDQLKLLPVETDYFSLARYKAERAAIRKERNTLEVGGGLQGAIASYNDSWIKVSGGDNSIALIANVFLRHTFTKNLFSIDTRFDARFGYNRMKVETKVPDTDEIRSDNVWFKNQDEFAISVAPSFKMSQNWSYGAIVKFRSQFANGYVSRSQQTEKDRKSTFMAPGYFDLSLGITYKSPQPKFPITVNLSPIAMSAIFVEDKTIRENTWDGKPGWQIYGLADVNHTSKYEGGSSIQIDFDRTFGKSEFLRYRTTLYSFYGWITDLGQKNKISNYTEYRLAYEEWVNAGKNPETKPNLPIHPTVRWENTFNIKATKYLATTFTFLLSYNRAQSTEVQTQMLLSVGLSYTFKNK